MQVDILRQMIFEVLADPQVGQKFKSTPKMPMTTSSGKGIEIVAVHDVKGEKYITFSVNDGDKSYQVVRAWSDITGDKGDWFEPVQEQKKLTRAYGKKTYGASPGSVKSIKKSGDSAKKAVAAGDFDWADDPFAAAQAAHIVATGEPTVRKGTKRKKS